MNEWMDGWMDGKMDESLPNRCQLFQLGTPFLHLPARGGKKTVQ